ncbi:MAG: hypothetical protein HY751_03100 [Nitrospinae bacterium]|nr:hypothetical protein [Nitrospinota bacterium]
MKILPFTLAVWAIIAFGPAMASNARPLDPVYIDRDAGFVYFLVENRWKTDIESLYGWVYGHGSPSVPGVYLSNNPHIQGMKVSLGSHVPGSAALYRFPLRGDSTEFPRYSLAVNDKSLFHPVNMRVAR